ncbi:MAG: hypothetical protein ACQGVC_06650 [Myxococcota bacterium]
MPARNLLGLAAVLLVACGDAPAGDAPVEAAPPTLPLTGTYQVSGTTVDKATGAERGVSGVIVVKAEGDRYTSTFSLNTTLHGAGEPQKAELIGQGEGAIEGRTLVGTAETQLIVALVPGVDAGFGMLPRVATARILNRSYASFEDDGKVVIQIQSEPAPGEEYSPTKTTLRGRRVADVGLGPRTE